MVSPIKCIITLAVFVLLSPVYANALSSLPWSSSFNYGPCSQRGGGGSSDCGTNSPDGIYFDWGGDSVVNNYTGVASAANNPAGAGGGGLRQWMGDGVNECSGVVRVDFPSPQKELWIRWYERYQAGTKWNWNYSSTTPYKKSLYLKTDGASNPYCGFFGNNGYRLYNQNSNGAIGSWPTANAGWNTVYPTGISDGTWHCYEVHVKMDTGSANGIGQIWIDGNLVSTMTNVNWSSNDSVSKNGWTWMEFLSNNQGLSNGGPVYVDVDDMAIYNTTPPNTDAQGNRFIGPIGGGSVAAKLAAPTNLKVN